MHKIVQLVFLVLTIFLTSCNFHSKRPESSKPKKKFTVAWSIYTGWQPWDYAKQSGILKKWADHYNIEIELKRLDYIPSVNAFSAKSVDACVMTNMEALDIPASNGVKSSVIIVGDYSNGNDAILARHNLDLKGLCGKEVLLVELSVSHYLLSRAYEKAHLNSKCLKLQNTNDNEIAPTFLSSSEPEAIVTWNPMVMKVKSSEKGITDLFNSSAIPEEILDLMVVNTETLSKNPELGKVLAGTWYEVMETMASGNTEERKSAIEIMAESAGCDSKEFEEQLKTTAMYYKPEDAYKFITSDSIVERMNHVKNFCFEYGLLGDKAKDANQIGIKYPNGVIQGDSTNIELIFDESFTNLKIQNKLW